MKPKDKDYRQLKRFIDLVDECTMEELATEIDLPGRLIDGSEEEIRIQKKVHVLQHWLDDWVNIKFLPDGPMMLKNGNFYIGATSKVGMEYQLRALRYPGRGFLRSKSGSIEGMTLTSSKLSFQNRVMLYSSRREI